MATFRQAVRRRLLSWFDEQQRDLPWRKTGDPYAILVSEVMLQQTRVAAVIPYYRRFMKFFPTARSLARARESNVLRAWAGLGYYARARRLQAAAAEIVKHGFPKTYDGLRQLPGVGDYTAAAVASIAFGVPHAVMDGNVRRVLARLLAEPAPDRADAEALLDTTRPGDFNQALMELGATVCLPQKPACPRCPLQRLCRAFREKRVAELPPPKPKRASERVHMRLALLRRGDAVLLEPPSDRGLWPAFWNLPSLRLSQERVIARLRHTVTFRRIEIEVVTGRLRRVPEDLVYVSKAQLARLALATPARKALASTTVL